MTFLRTVAMSAAIAAAMVRPGFGGETIAGLGKAIDGDTFKIGEAVIRLADIDAPEIAQRCEGGPKHLSRCGAYVADLLRSRLAEKEVSCDVREIDQYDRRIARCSQGTRSFQPGWFETDGPWRIVPRAMGGIG